MGRAEADDARAPHHRLLAGDVGQQAAEDFGVGAAGIVLDRREEVGDRAGGGDGLGLGHGWVLLA